MNSAATVAIRAYQMAASPLLGGGCRYFPTCSHYGIEAFQKHSFFKATKLTLSRILRCRPGGAAGFDPLPEEQQG